MLGKKLVSLVDTSYIIESMTIREFRFSGGYPVCKTEQLKSLNQAEILAKALESDSGQLSTFAPGTFDVTPSEFRNPAYQYLLTVKRDGTGALAMSPRHPDSVLSEKPGGSDPKDWE